MGKSPPAEAINKITPADFTSVTGTAYQIISTCLTMTRQGLASLTIA